MKLNSNYCIVKFKAISVNEMFARSIVSSFCLQLNPTVGQLDDIKTAVSEAVTNCIVHAYPNRNNGEITLSCEIMDNDLKIEISDKGVGIKDIEKARQAFFTTRPNEDRSGMGFVIMETFMDKMDVSRNSDKGITVTLYKHIEQEKEAIV